ncbi:SanA/YdcF family protein [Vicingus serpentipes]|uniref:SanA/YdcF family protein n=1 Tax=Vicingus serpentipes TaxID=1926625 RepID=UPI001CB9950B|nr:ElyC/SanA/YdcF family protein [Vicingus serpentipes]
MKFLIIIKNLILNKWTISISIVLIGFVLFSNILIANYATEKIFSKEQDTPEKPVALLLGTSRYTVRGNTNLYFKYRIEATTSLYKSGKIKHIIVSGDNSLSSYNEPREMRKALIANGIPDSSITLDFAGFRTLDSVVRCKEVFGQDNFIIISQRFHLERALYIAKKFNIHAIGFAAQDPPEKYSFKTNVREYFARTKAIIDLYILNTQPKFLGEKEIINL